jgi:pimeloyl-ACP methyl ester carboxylesterase
MHTVSVIRQFVAFVFAFLLLPQPALSEVHEEDVRFAGATLAGTLYTPGPGRHAAILVLPGAIDAGRKSPMLARIGAVIREPLLARGFAVFFYDKPGIGESRGRPAETLAAEARAAESALRFLAHRPEVDPRRIVLYAVSHSGWVAPIVAVRHPETRAVVLVSTAAFSPLEQSVFAMRNLDELTRNDPPLAARSGDLRRAIYTYLTTGRGYEEAHRADAAIASDTALRYLRSESPRIPSPLPAPGERVARLTPFFRDAAFDPVPWLGRIRQPTIAVFGENDPLVDAKHSAAVFRRLGAKRPGWDLTVKVYSGAGHGIEVRKPGGPVHDPTAPRPAGYPDDLLEWLTQKTGEGR